ncbi:MAG: hypothetical protein IJ339_05410 [Oscillospiraceae bacterium]|nr:hypothetical protein [Oscillospiraceae bacterium]
MKKIKVFILFITVFLLTGCKEYGEKRIVTLMTADSENVAVYYYDFSSDEPSYLKEERENNGIENALIDILSKADYNLKLCKYAVVSKDIVESRINEVFFAVTDARFATDIAVIEGDTEKPAEFYTKIEKSNYPLYTYKVRDNNITGIVEKADENEKHIIYNNSLYKTIDPKQSFVIDMLTESIDRGIYVFENNTQQLAAYMENISSFYSEKDDNLHINISAVLKSYKGMPAGDKERQQFVELLKKSIKKETENILEDDIIVQSCDLLWYSKVEKFENVTVNIKII